MSLSKTPEIAWATLLFSQMGAFTKILSDIASDSDGPMSPGTWEHRVSAYEPSEKIGDALAQWQNMGREAILDFIEEYDSYAALLAAGTRRPISTHDDQIIFANTWLKTMAQVAMDKAVEARFADKPDTPERADYAAKCQALVNRVSDTSRAHD